MIVVVLHTLELLCKTEGVTRGISDTGFGWVGLLGALFFFSDIEKILYFWVYLYTFGTFWAQELDKSTPCTMWESADPQSALLECENYGYKEL